MKTKRICLLMNVRECAEYKMSIEQAIEILRNHNAWRNGAAVNMVRPELVTLAIETIIKHYENTPEKI